MINGILDEIKHLSEEIEITIVRLNEVSIWLFLAAIGCWGVSNKDMQLLAMVIIAFYFFDQVFSGHLSKKSYSSRIDELEKSTLSAKLTEDEINQLISALTRYCKSKLRFKYILQSGVKYFICTLFYFLSLCLFLSDDLESSIFYKFL